MVMIDSKQLIKEASEQNFEIHIPPVLAFPSSAEESLAGDKGL